MSNTVRRGDRGLGQTPNGGTAGSFAAHDREAAAGPTEIGEFYVQREFSEDVQLTWRGDELGLETLGVHMVETQCVDENRYLVATIYEDPVAAGCLTQEQYDRGRLHVEHVMREEYGAEFVQYMDEDEMQLEFTVDLGDQTSISDHEASQSIWDETKLVKFHNETDRGTFGSPFIYSRIAETIDRGFFPPATMPAFEMRESAHFALGQQDPDPKWEQLAMLRTRGYCEDSTRALRQLHACVAERGSNHYTDRLLHLLQDELVRKGEAER